MLTNFNPVRLSTAENEFLLKHLGEPSIVALRDVKGVPNPKAHPKDKNPIIYPEGVIPGAVKPILDGVYELLELEKHEGFKWVGVQAVKTAIQRWLEMNKKWKVDAQRYRNAPRYPSLYAFDARGKGHFGAVGSDSGEVKSYFDEKGSRKEFTIDLLNEYVPEWSAPSMVEDQSPESAAAGLYVDRQALRIECRVPKPDGTICGHTEKFRADHRASYNAARARISRHLRKATEEVEAHRELHSLEFSSGDRS